MRASLRLRAAQGWCLYTVLTLAVPGCGTPYVERELVPAVLLDQRTDLADRFLEAHLHDGSVVVFSEWGFDGSGDHLIGLGETFDAHRRSRGVGEVSLAIQDIAIVETNVIERSNRIGGLAILYGLTAAVAITCVTRPKTCFGSCPTFYVDRGEGAELRAEGFSASVSPALEATDRDALGVVPVANGRIVVTMKNEAFETHVVRSADLEVVAPRPAERGTAGRTSISGSARALAPGTEVVTTPAGELLVARAAAAPERCHDGERDWCAEVREFDGWARSVSADSTDLAAREELALTFAARPEGRLGLVVSARQSLVSTYVFYQALAWMGNDVGRWLAQLERLRPEERRAFLGPGEVLGRIEVEVRRPDGSWVSLGACGETGPLATDTWCLPFAPDPAEDHASLDPPGGAGPVEVRLRAARGLWRIDRIALVSLDEPAEALRLRPAEVWRDGQRDHVAEAALLDDEAVLVTFPGDVYELVYTLPEEATSAADSRAGDDRTADSRVGADFAPDDRIVDGEVVAFLESRGYYLEGMRDAWLAEEDPAKVARLLLDPRSALREMAPAFHDIEDEMEQMFWSSQYVAP